MKVNNDEYAEFVHWRENNDEIYKYYRRKRVSVKDINSGNFSPFLKFPKHIYKLYRQIKIDSPAANRLFLYLMEICLDYPNDPKSEITFNPKKLSYLCNIKNVKTLYDAVMYLQDRNMIFVMDKEYEKTIKLNPSILSWNVDEDKKMCVYKKELDRMGIEVSE
jgi:hypothetical protein